jgi:hypothetical protein
MVIGMNRNEMKRRDNVLHGLVIGQARTGVDRQGPNRIGMVNGGERIGKIRLGSDWY